MHGNGSSTPQDNWWPYVKSELEKRGCTVLAPQFPDAPLCREKYWMPFLKELGADEHTILIGHSTGAVAAMRFAENNKILGSVLIAGCETDLGVESERLSGYFDNPWKWNAIKENQRFIVQFASIDDPWIPITEARSIHKNLDTEYHEFPEQGHFGGDREKLEFPELIQAVMRKISKEI